MANARSKAVLGELADLWSRGFFAVDMMRDLREPLGYGDIIDVPDISALTVIADGATQTAAVNPTTNVLTLTANLHPWINVELGFVAKTQLMDGKWAKQVGEQATIQLKNYMDEQLLRNYLALELCFATGSTAPYHDNVAGASLTSGAILASKAALLAQDGVQPQNLMMIVSPYGEGSIMNISSFIPNASQAEQGNLGIPKLGTVHGVPVFSSNSVLRNRQVATTAAVTTGSGTVHTYTVAAGHGLVPGMLATVTGHDADENIATPTAIVSVTATTVVINTTATADGTSSLTAGTIRTTTSYNLLLDRSQIFVAQQAMPQAREVAHDDSTGTAMQIYTLWGRVGRQGRCRVLHSPGSAV